MILQRQTRIGDYIPYINKLMGFSDLCLIHHWAAKGKDIHEYLDEFNKELREYMDNLMESLMGIGDQISTADMKPEFSNNPNPGYIIIRLQEETIEFRDKIKCPGIQSIVDDFLGVLDKYSYLFNLCSLK